MQCTKTFISVSVYFLSQTYGKYINETCKFYSSSDFKKAQITSSQIEHFVIIRNIIHGKKTYLVCSVSLLFKLSRSVMELGWGGGRGRVHSHMIDGVLVGNLQKNP